MNTLHQQRAVTLDVYMCNFGGDHNANAQALLDDLIRLFVLGYTQRRLLRGD